MTPHVLPFARSFAAAAAAAALLPALTAQEVIELPVLEVTAQGRLQTVFDVPVPVTAYTGGFLEEQGIVQFKDLAPFVPGFFVQEQSPNNPGINIRGITTDSGDPRSETRVSIFQDGVSISRSRGSVVELFDMQRVEVLKGPQGTLFGRGAEIGALSLIQNKPSPRYDAQVSASLGNYASYDIRGFINAPAADGDLAFRVAFAFAERDGTVRNVADGSDLNGRSVAAVRTSARWTPSDRTTVDIIFNYQNDNPPGTAFKSGTIPPTGGDTSPFTFAELTAGAGLYLDRTVVGLTGLVRHDLGNGWEINSITGWRTFDSYERFDADGAGVPLLEFAEDAEGEQFSQEIRLNFDDKGAFAGFLGAGFFQEDGSQRVPFYGNEQTVWPFLSGQFRSGLIGAGVPASLANAAIPTLNPFVPQATLPASFAFFNNPALPASIRQLSFLAGAPLKASHNEEFTNFGETTAIDVFADGTWRVTDRFSVTGGVRLTWEDYTSGYEVIGDATPATIGFILGTTPNLVFAPTNGRREASGDQTSWVARAIASYELSSELNAYAGVARGRRPESILVDATTVSPLKEEIVWNYEAGLKGTGFDGRFRWSASAFLYDYSNFQTTVADPNTPGRFINQDAGNATGQGFELAADAQVLPQVRLFATYGYTDATFDDTGDNGQRQEYAGFSFRLTAKHTIAAGALFEQPFDDIGTFFVAPTWQYKSEHYFEDDNANFNYSLRQGGFGLVNLRAGWRSPDGRWTVEFQAENLFDRDYLIDAGNTGGSFGIPTFIPGSPQLWSVGASYRL